MRVLVVSTLFPNPVEPGKGVNVLKQMRRLAADTDVEPTIIAPLPRFPLPLPGAPYSALASVPAQRRQDELTVHHPRYISVPRVGRRFNGQAEARAVIPLARELHETEPFDLVSGEFFFPDAWAVHLTAKALRLPYSLKARGSDIRHWGRYRHARRQMVGAGRHAHGLLAVSASLRDDMVSMGLPRERIDVHYTGVDLQQFRPSGAKAAAQAEAGGRLLAIGNLVDLKRVDLLIDAMTHLPAATLNVIGEGPGRSRLAARIERLDLGGRVTLLGRLPHEEVHRHLACADALVHASRSEGLANVWVEALASGTPVITCDAGGARETVPANAGRVVPVDISAEAFAAAVRDVLADPPAAAAVRAAAEKFSWENNLSALRRHYARVAGRGDTETRPT